MSAGPADAGPYVAVSPATDAVHLHFDYDQAGTDQDVHPDDSLPAWAWELGWRFAGSWAVALDRLEPVPMRMEEAFIYLVEQARAAVPRFNVTTDIIVGFPGETEQEWQETLAFVAEIGFGDVHTRAHIYRAILEGLGYGLKEGLLVLQKRNKRPITSLMVSGGGSQSDAAMQITADIFNLPAQRPHTYETSALGAAIDAAVGLKLHPDFDSAIRDMTRVANTFEPIPRNRDLYHELYERVYRKLYRRLKPIYNDIRAITGYPAM